MVYTRRKLSKKKNNSTRKLKGGSVFNSVVDTTASFGRSAIDNTTGDISRISPYKQAVGSTAAGTAVGAATFMTVGLATGLPATTFLTAQISAATMSALGPLGISTAGIAAGSAAASADALAGPIGTAVGAALFVAYTTYSVSRKERIKKRVKHFIKKQMLDILDKMNEKSKQSKLGETKYPPLKHYDQFQANVKQFFIDYQIFDKLAEIFISMQSSMLHFYPSEKLMLPIHFQQRKEGEPDDGMKLDLNQEPFKKYRVGSNFICFYDYLSTYDYLYFHCDQLNDGNTRQFVRVKLSSKFMTSKTPEEICKYFKKRLQYVYGAKDSKPTSDELYQARDLKQEVKKPFNKKDASTSVETSMETQTDEVKMDGSLDSDDEFDEEFDEESDKEFDEENDQSGGGPIGDKINNAGAYRRRKMNDLKKFTGFNKVYTFDVPDIPAVDNGALMGLTVDQTGKGYDVKQGIRTFTYDNIDLDKKFLGIHVKRNFYGDFIVDKVNPDGVQKDQIRVNDIILSVIVNDTPYPLIDDTNLNTMLTTNAGKIELKIKEGRRSQDMMTFKDTPIRDIKIEPKDRGKVLESLNYYKMNGFLGLFKEGLEIKEVQTDSGVEKIGLRKGDVIISINGIKFSSLEEFVSIYKQNIEDDELVLQVREKKEYSYAEGAALRTGQAIEATLGLAIAPVVISYVGLTKLFRSNVVDVVTINNNDVKKSSRAISKENSITTEFAKNVMVLMQFPPFVKVISEQIRDFKTSYLQDFQAQADDEDGALDFTPTQTPEEAALEAKVAEMRDDLKETETERDTARSEAAGLKEKYKESEEKEALEKQRDQKLLFDLDYINKEKSKALRAAVDTNAKQLMEIQSDKKYTGTLLPEQKPPQKKPTEEKEGGEGLVGGALFGPSMRARGNVIKSSKSKMFQGLRTRKFTEDEKRLFIEFVYYSTYAFYHVFSKTLKVRESEMKKFFGDYIDDLMEMFKKNFSTVINRSSIYISIARALAITFEKKLGAAFNIKSLQQQQIMGEQSKENIKAIDRNRDSTLNEAGQIEKELEREKIFSTDLFFKLKNKKIRDFIFKTYRNIRDLENAMDDSNLANRQFKVASRLDYRFTVEILGKEPMKQGLIENAQVRQALANVFSGNFGMFRNVLEDIDKHIDEFDGISTDKLLAKLQLILPKLTSFGPEGMVFQFDERLLKMGTGQGDLLSQQIEEKRRELRELERKQSKVASLIKKDSLVPTD